MKFTKMAICNRPSSRGRLITRGSVGFVAALS